MANELKVMTGSIAIVRKNGTAIGKMRNVRWTENIGRGEVRGLGTILTSEAPALTWGGTVSCDFYEVDFTTTGVPDAIKRNVQTSQEFETQLLLDYDGVQLDIFKKVEDVVVDGLKKSKNIPYVTLTQLLIESDGAEVTEGAISGHNQAFRYLGPAVKRA